MFNKKIISLMLVIVLASGMLLAVSNQANAGLFDWLGGDKKKEEQTETKQKQEKDKQETKANKPADWPDKIKLGAVPTENAMSLSTKLEPLVNYLEDELGVEVEIFHATDYRGVIEALRFGKIDIAKLGPKSYIEAKDNYGKVEPIVKFISNTGSPGYRSCLIASTGTGIYSPEDAKGAEFAFNDPNSTSGYLVPMTLFLQKMKVKPKEYFSKVTFSGSHEASIIAVANSNVEVASTNLNAIKRAENDGQIEDEDLNVIWVSDLIPNDPFVVRSELPDSFKTALQDSFANVDQEAISEFLWSGFQKVDDAHYQPVRDLNNLKKQLDK